MARPRHPLTIPYFRAYFLSRLAGTIATTSFGILIGWQVYSIARGPEGMGIREAAFLLGMIGLAQFVPLFLLTPVVGLVADTVDRRLIVRATTALLLATVATLGLLTWYGALTIPALFAGAVLIGVARAFGGPAYSALAPNLVSTESLPTAIAVSSIAWQFGSIIGPSLGGLLFGFSPLLAYGVSTALLGVALFSVMLIGPVPQPPVEPDQRPLARVVEGFAYVRANRLVLATITLDLFAVLLAGATALLPIYARDILQVGPHGLGLLAAGMGIGASAVAFFFSVRPMRTNVGVKMLWSVIVFGLATLVFGLATPITALLGLPSPTVGLPGWAGGGPLLLSPAFILSLVALIVAGAADMVSVYVRSSLIQLHTPDAMRGRVGAVSQLTVSASNELGEAESGLLAALVGPVGAVVVGGVGAIVVTLVWAGLFPELRLAKTFAPPDMPERDHATGAVP
ncbi:MFS transporter [Sphingomonas sp.]|jgi:MFS family permease|uniref:MFS transporter n=1 Tax=Sphingomonas sp. TaxID=28214 RepID=UPI002D7F37AA|nr:MFS transporter [Sphingomonas sp.]HEU0044983.1 MFS transporter [Sphingomonas sp.]